jgi:hypothetical protein
MTTFFASKMDKQLINDSLRFIIEDQPEALFTSTDIVGSLKKGINAIQAALDKKVIEMNPKENELWNKIKHFHQALEHRDVTIFRSLIAPWYLLVQLLASLLTHTPLSEYDTMTKAKEQVMEAREALFDAYVSLAATRTFASLDEQLKHSSAANAGEDNHLSCSSPSP